MAISTAGIKCNSRVNFQSTVSITAPTIEVHGTLRVSTAISSGIRSFNVFNGAITGQFENIVLPELDDGYSWDLSEIYTLEVLLPGFLP